MEKKVSTNTTLLRQKAEEHIKKKQSEKLAYLNDSIERCHNITDHLKVIHELEVTQIELEMQNEELRSALDNAATATTLYDFSPFGYFTIDRDGTIIEMNLNGAILLGKLRSELINGNFKRFVSLDTLQEFEAFLKNAYETNAKQICEVKLATNGNSSLYIHLEGFVEINKQKCIVTSIDITGHKLTGDAIRLSESRLRRAELTSKTGNWEFHVDSQKIYASEGANKLYGIQKNQFEYSDIKKVTLPEYRPLLDLAIIKLIEENKPYDVEFKIKTQDTGEIRDIHSIATYDREKRILFGSIQDITDNKIIQNRIYESELYYRTMVETSPDAIVILDAAGQIQFLSQTAYEIFLLPSDFQLGNSSSQWIAPEMRESTFRRINNILSGIIEPECNEYQILRYDDTMIWAEIHGSRLKNAAGQTKGLFLICRDITERKNTEKTLQLAHEELKNLHDNLDEAIFSFDPVHNKMLQASKAHEDIFGYPSSEFFKNPQLWHEMIVQEDKPIVDAGFPILRSGKIQNQEYRIIRPDGQIRWIAARMRPTLDKDGNLVQIDGIAYDITQRKQAEEENMESEERFRMVFENVFDGIAIYDEDHDPYKRKLIECNEQYAQMVGRSREELLKLGHTQALQITIEDSSNKNRLQSLSLNKAYQGSYSWIRPDGKDNVIEYIRVPIIWRGKSYSIGIDRDITEHKRADEEIKKSLSLLTATLNSTTDGILVVNKKGKITHYNKKFIDLWRIPLTNRSTWNEQIEISFVFDQLKDPDSFIKKIEEMEMNEEESSFDLLEFKDGRTVERYSQPQTLEGKSVGRVWNFRDITKSKRDEAELIAAKEKAEESDRLKSAFLANMSHEIRTPLNSIIVFSELMSDPDFDREQECEFAQIINTSGNNLLSIISDIMDISKIEAGQVHLINQLFSVNQLITDLQKEYLYKAIEKGIELILDPTNPSEEVFIESDQSKIRQIIVNLVENSIKFTEIGTIKLGIRITGTFIEFHVRDTGIGIPIEFQTQIFERFRQVESAYSRKYGGTGLGLAISKSLTELMGGTLWLESEQGNGSTFYFTIPIQHEHLFKSVD